jgi:ribose/xylose/arabinose/galactoside ABC-type transport system permease subunit
MPEHNPSWSTKDTLSNFSERFSWRISTIFLWLFVLTCAAGALAWYGQSVSENFLGPVSLEAIWDTAFPWVLIVGPMALIMLGGGLDLSVGAVAALTSVITVSALANGESPQDAFIIAMIFAGAIGLVHALLVAVATINPIVLTLVTALLIQNAASIYAAGQPIILGQDAGFIESLHTSPMLIAISAGVSLLLIHLSMTRGRSGQDPISRQRWLHRVFIIAPPFVLSSLAAGVVGCSLGGRYPLAVPDNADMNTTFMVILAAVIGGNCTGRRFGTVAGAVAGAVILAATQRLMLMESVDPSAQMRILAGSAGAGLLLSQLTYWIINLLYRKSRRKQAA